MEGSPDDREVLDQLTMLADELMQQAGEIRRQWVELADVLGAELPEPEERPALVPVASPQSGSEGETESEFVEDQDPIRLVALDMMLSGRSRDEVRAYLDATFGDGDREAVLDEIFTRFG